MSAQATQLTLLLDAIERGAASWSQFLSQLQQFERHIRGIEKPERDPLLKHIQHAEHFAEREHLSMARASVQRVAQLIP